VQGERGWVSVSGNSKLGIKDPRSRLPMTRN
jgi:hypothetical protein